MKTWDRLLSEEDRVTLERGRWAQRGGFGERPCLLVIDAQNYMSGERAGDSSKYPYACGEVGWKAIDRMVEIVEKARAVPVPVVFTRLIVDPAIEGDGGVLGTKVGAQASDFAFFKNTPGSEIVRELTPRAGELVIDKKRFSAFFGTPLLSHLTERQVDTVIVVGGSTSNCVRATVVDAASYNFRTIVPTEAVFDRISICHEVSLFDINRSYADVVSSDQVVEYLDGRRR